MYIDDRDGRNYKRFAPSRKQSENYMSIVNVVVREAMGADGGKNLKTENKNAVGKGSESEIRQ